MKKLLILFGALAALVSCSNKGNGELVGVQGDAWKDPTPYGMVFIPSGSFTMGPNDQDANWALSSQSKVVSVDAFWMDETEITNREYKQFVYWVRDSIARTKLGEVDEAFLVTQDKRGNELEKPRINWKPKIPWSKANEEQAEAIDAMFYADDESIALKKN